MKKKLYLIIPILVFAITIALLFFLVRPASNKDMSNEISISNLALMNGADNIHYLRGASPNIVFHIVNPNNPKETAFAVTDINGNLIETGIQQEGEGYGITAPEGGYTPGKQYVLELHRNTVLADDELRDVQTLIFSIARESVEEYSFTDKVSVQTTPIPQVEDDRITIQNTSIRQGDILFGQDISGDYVAYKIDTLLSDGTAIVSLPALDEVYQDLNVYGDYKFDPASIKLNPELESQVISSVRNSAFFDFLVTTAYATEPDSSENPKVKFEFIPDKEIPNNEDENKIGFKIDLIFSPTGEDLFGIDGFNDHIVTITLRYIVSISPHTDISSPTSWDIAATTTTFFDWDIKIERQFVDDDMLTDIFNKVDPHSQHTSSNDNDNTADTNSEQSQAEDSKFIREITRKLSEGEFDDAEYELHIFDWPLEIPVIPGLCFHVRLSCCFEGSFFLQGQINRQTECTSTIGVKLYEGEFSSYSSKKYSENSTALSLGGRAKIKAGGKITFMFEFIDEDIANVKFEPEMGAYAEVFAAGVLLLDEGVFSGGAQCYCEMGGYFEAPISAYVNLIGLDDLELIVPTTPDYEPDIQWGSKDIPIGIRPQPLNVIAYDNIALAPTFYYEFFDIKEMRFDEEFISFSMLEFTLEDGTPLTKNQGGYIQLPDGYHHEESLCITASYTHSNGKKYSDSFWMHTLNVYTTYEDLLERRVTDSGQLINYYAYLDLNKDGIPELIVADADGTPSSWTTGEVYTYLEPEIKFCGRTNSRWDYFYHVNNEYFLGRHRLGNEFISADGYLITRESNLNYEAMPTSDVPATERFIQTAEPINLLPNCYGDISPDVAIQLLYEAIEYYENEIFARDYIDATLHSIDDFSWAGDVIEYEGGLYVPGKYTYDEYLSQLHALFTEDVVDDIVKVLGLIEYEGKCYTYIMEGAGAIYMGDYEVTSVTASGNDTYVINASFTDVALDEVTVQINCRKEGRQWKMDSFDFFRENDAWYPFLVEGSN